MTVTCAMHFAIANKQSFDDSVDGFHLYGESKDKSRLSINTPTLNTPNGNLMVAAH